MKFTKTLYFALFLLLLIKTEIYWRTAVSGFYTFLIIGICIALLFLGCAFLWKIYKVIRNKGKEKSQNIELGLLAVIVLLIVVLPNKDFREEPPVLLEAYRELPAGGTTLTFYKDGTFKNESFCFGFSVEKGKYHQSNDTLFLEGGKMRQAVIDSTGQLILSIEKREIPYSIVRHEKETNQGE